MALPQGRPKQAPFTWENLRIPCVWGVEVVGEVTKIGTTDMRLSNRLVSGRTVTPELGRALADNQTKGR